jgi:glycosyltransferase involved in cell wall biosynthesis
VVTEIVIHKRVEDALVAARRAGQRIKVVGSGPDSARLAAKYGDSAECLGRVADEELARVYSMTSLPSRRVTWSLPGPAAQRLGAVVALDLVVAGTAVEHEAVRRHRAERAQGVVPRRRRIKELHGLILGAKRLARRRLQVAN